MELTKQNIKKHLLDKIGAINPHALRRFGYITKNEQLQVKHAIYINHSMIYQMKNILKRRHVITKNVIIKPYYLMLNLDLNVFVLLNVLLIQKKPGIKLKLLI